jgi:class 3 adenylate cyclase
MFSGFLRLYAAQYDLATAHLEISLRLNPRDQRGLHLSGMGIAFFFDRRFDEALDKLLAALQEFPGYATPYRFAAACYAQMGRLDDARRMVQRLRMITPIVLHNASQYRNPEHRELFLSGLRLAAGNNMNQTRRLAAILAADVAGYSRLIGADEETTLNRLRSSRIDVIDPKIVEHRGRMVKTTGDGLLLEFASVVDALRCATEIQKAMAAGNVEIAAQKSVEFRMGINVGDIVVENGDIFGDGVNIAARLEGLAEPGGICVSARVQEDAAGKLDLTFEDMGDQTLKNIARPVRVYRVRDTASKSASAVAPSVLPLPVNRP